jgi:hypothetical protein
MKNDLTMVGEPIDLLRFERTNSLGAGDGVSLKARKEEGRTVPPRSSQPAGQPQLRAAILTIS